MTKNNLFRWKNRLRNCLFILYLVKHSIHLFLCYRFHIYIYIYLYMNIYNHWLWKNHIAWDFMVVMSIGIPLWRLTSQLNVKPYQLSALSISIMTYPHIVFSSQVTQWFELLRGTTYFLKCSVYFLKKLPVNPCGVSFGNRPRNNFKCWNTERCWQGHFKEAQGIKKKKGYGLSSRFWRHVKNKMYWPIL